MRMDHWKILLRWHTVTTTNDLTYLYKYCGSCDSMLPLHPRRTDDGVELWCLAPRCKYTERPGLATIESMKEQLNTLSNIGYH